MPPRPIALPAINNTHLPLPQNPAVPASKTDLAEARSLTHDAVLAYSQNKATDEELANAAIYDHTIASSLSGEPEWFANGVEDAVRRVLNEPGGPLDTHSYQERFGIPQTHERPCSHGL
ncbi:hypothetical protein H0H92_003486 [Tricholoma furcatifolium]|nr:hypothetical protein H0H92_003486 [Tricholoma furcatifolium]